MKTNKVSFVIVLGIWMMLSISSQALAETEPNNNYGSPNAISLDSPVTGTISTNGDVDWYTLTTDVVGDLTVTYKDWPGFIETRIEVFGPNNPSLAQGLVLPLSPGIYKAAAPGTYYFKVWSANDGSSTTPYIFNVSLKKAITGNDIDGGTNSASGAVPITVGSDVSDTIAPSKETAGKQDVDWYTLTTDVVGDLTVTYKDWPGFIETRIEVFGPNNPSLAQGLVLPLSPGIYKAAAPGTYYIKMWSAVNQSSISPYKFNSSLKKAITGNDIDGGTNSASGAVPITIGTAVSDTIAPSKETAGKQDVDWYTLTTDAVGDLTVTQTEWPGYIETRIAVYGPNDPALAQNNPVKNAAPGTYYIKVWSANDGSSIAPYKFNVNGKQSTTTTPISTPTTQVTSTPTPGTTPAVGTYKKCEGTQPYLYIEDRTMDKGKTVVIPVMMCNADNLANMDLTINYDSSILKIKDIIKGSLNAKALFDWNPVSAGKLKISFASKEGVSGSGSIAIMTFEVIGNTGASTTITGTVTTASRTDGSRISVSVIPGTFTVGTSTISTGTSTVPDCDGSGKLTEKHALASLQMAVEKRALNICYDYNKDGKVDSSDARFVLKAIVSGG